MKLVGPVHHADHALDQVVAIAERAGLAAVAEDRDVFAAKGLPNEVRDHAAVERMHPRAVGVEDPHDPHIEVVHAVVVHEQRFGRALAFVVAGARADRIDRAAIVLGLRMDLGIAVDFAGRGLQDFRPAAFGHAQHVDRAQHRGLDRLDRVVLIVAGRGGAGEVVDLVDFQQDRLRDVVPDQLEIRPVEQMGDVRLLAGEKIVEADHVVPVARRAARRGASPGSRRRR